MSKLSFDQLLDAGVHFGHLKRKWNPSMAPYIFEEKKGIHIIDLNKTLVHLDQACSAMKQIAKSGKKVLFVATKKQAKDIVAEKIATFTQQTTKNHIIRNKKKEIAIAKTILNLKRKNNIDE